MVHQDDDQMSTLADLSQTVDSPMMRAMSGELVDLDTLAVLVAIAASEDGLGVPAWPHVLAVAVD
jgi:hypothetical protein